ncbi:MAG: IPT/TIG domain-containing protein [Pseudomonadota bacterium]
MTSLLPLPVLLALAPACAPFNVLEGNIPGDCGDGLDNDEDGLFDCDDDGCRGAWECSGADTDTDTDNDTDTDTDTDTDVDIAIEAIGPAWGSTAGGEQVTLEGGPFDTTASVHFGSAPAAVTDITPTTLTVYTPAADLPGLVDVSVRTAEGHGTARDGFIYFTDGTGLAGVIGEITWTTYAGSFWKDPTPWGSAWLTFIEPADFHIWDLHGPGDDTCVASSWSSTAVLHPQDPQVEALTLTPSTGTPSTLTWDPIQQNFRAGDLSAAQLPTSALLRIEEFEGWGLVPTSLNPATRIPPAVAFISPTMSGTTPATVSRSAFAVQWSGNGGDRMLLQAVLLNAASTAVDETVTCVLTDDGAFTIPSTAWPSFPTGRHVMLHLTRLTEYGATLEHNGADNRVVGGYQVIGLVQTN